MKKLLSIAIILTLILSNVVVVDAASKKPAKVKFATCSSTISSVTLKWKKAKNAKKYQVYQLKGKKYKKIKTVKTKKLVVKKLKANTRYKFKVRGINGKKTGKFSKVKTITTKKKAASGGSTSGGTNTDATSSENDNVTSVEFIETSVSVGVSETKSLQASIGVKGSFKPVKDKFAVSSKDSGIATASVTSITSSTPYKLTVKITGAKSGSTKITLSGYGQSDTISVNVSGSGNASGGGTEGGGGTDQTQGLKYDYEFYKLNNHSIYNNEPEWLICLSTNPLTYEGDEFCLKDKNTGKIIRAKDYLLSSSNGMFSIPGLSKPSIAKQLFKDIGFDATYNNMNVYLFYTTFTTAGSNEYQLIEYYDDGDERSSSTTQIINIQSYSNAYDSWINKVINDYSNSSMSATEKMLSISSGLQNNSTYFNAGENGHNYYHGSGSLKIRSLAKFESNCWDSAYTAPLETIADKLGFTNITVDKRSNSKHAIVKMQYNGSQYEYHMCPKTSTAKLLTEYCPQLTINNNYTKIATFTE